MTDKTPTVLVTSGPTRAYFDRIRYIANTSTGALGAFIVEELSMRNIAVVHLFGTGSRRTLSSGPGEITEKEIVTVDDLTNAIDEFAVTRNIAAVVHAMAVLDYVPEETKAEKYPSGKDCWDIRLVKTPKVAAHIREILPSAWMVGFKLESGITEEELYNRAKAMMLRYNLDLTVANLLENVHENRHDALIIDRDGIRSSALTKHEIASYLADTIASVLRNTL